MVTNSTEKTRKDLFRCFNQLKGFIKSNNNIMNNKSKLVEGKIT